MKIGWLATLGRWIANIFGGNKKKVTVESSGDQRPIFLGCNFSKSNLTIIKEDAKKMVDDISKEFRLPPIKANEFRKIVDGSYSEESLIYNMGAVSGSTATASGVPYEKVNDYANKWWSSKYQLVCANCRTPREFDERAGAASYVCHKCGADIFTLEPRDT